MLLAESQTIWGNLRVFGQGLEVEYDVPTRSQQGSTKTSYLLYQPEMERALALCRYLGHLTEDEQRRRLRQVEARFHPDRMRRTRRSILNIFNTIRDAFTQAMNAFIGQMGKAGGKASVARSQQGELQKIGKSLLGGVGNAYEPMLERHIGKPVVLEMICPTDPEGAKIEVCGYLAEYSDKYLAVFNVEQPVHETITLPIDQATERDDLKVEVDSTTLCVTNTSSVPLVIEAVIADGGEIREHGVVLPRAASAQLPKLPGSLSLRLLRAPRIDVVCHRSRATIRYAGLEA